MWLIYKDSNTAQLVADKLHDRINSNERPFSIRMLGAQAVNNDGFEMNRNSGKWYLSCPQEWHSKIYNVSYSELIAGIDVENATSEMHPADIRPTRQDESERVYSYYSELGKDYYRKLQSQYSNMVLDGLKSETDIKHIENLTGEAIVLIQQGDWRSAKTKIEGVVVDLIFTQDFKDQLINDANTYIVPMVNELIEITTYYATANL